MKDPRQAAREFAGALAATLGDRLRSVVLYGSVARGEAVPGVSDINVLVLLDRIDPAALRTAAPAARRWADAGNTAPLLMAWSEWRRASDSFAVEFADMRDAHEVLHGDDPLDGLSIEPTALRLQTERELRGKLLQLREGMLLAGERRRDIGRLLMLALPSFVTYFRAVLRLAGRPAPLRSESAIEEAAALVEADPAPFLDVWRARVRRVPPSVPLDAPLVTGYYALAERTAGYVDALAQEREE